MMKKLFPNGLGKTVKTNVTFKTQANLDVKKLVQLSFKPDDLIGKSTIHNFMTRIVENPSKSLTNTVNTFIPPQISNVETIDMSDTLTSKSAQEIDGKIYQCQGKTILSILFDGTIRIINKKILHSLRNDIERYYQISVFNQKTTKIIDILEQDYAEKAFSTIMKKCPEIRFYSSTTGGNLLMKDFMNELISKTNLQSLPEIHEFKYSGWEYLNGKWVYLHGGLNNVNSNRCLTNFDNPQKSFYDFFRLSKMLLISTFEEKSTIIFLHAHLGYLARLLQEAHFPPHYLLFVKGKTNTGKTSLLSEIGGEIMYDNPPQARLEDTRSYLEGVISEMQDTLFLIDDAHPSPTLQMDREIRQNIELIIRAYGDFQTRGKRGINRVDLEKTSICGAVWLTGEYLNVAAQSSTLRILEIELEENSVNRETLTVLQRNKNIAKSYFSGYVYFLQNNFNELVRYFRDDLYPKRKFWQNKLQTDIARSVDIAVSLEFITYSVFKYGEYTGCSLSDWYNATIFSIEKILQNKLKNDEKSDPIEVFKNTFQELYDSGALKIASSKEQFRLNIDFIGYENGNFFTCINASIEKAINSRCKEKGLAYIPPTLKQLCHNGIILEDKPKRFSQCRSDNARPTMISIKKFF